MKSESSWPLPGGRERRGTVRVTPDPLLVVRLPSGNGGIVLDVSERGMGVLASAPVREQGPHIRFSVSARSVELCQASGRVVWRDPAGLRVGIQFTKLPQELRSVVRSCAERLQYLEDSSLVPESEVLSALGSCQEALADTRSASLERSVADSPLSDPDLLARKNRWASLANALTVLLACAIAVAIWHPLAGPSLDPSQWRAAIPQRFSQLESYAQNRMRAWLLTPQGGVAILPTERVKQRPPAEMAAASGSELGPSDVALRSGPSVADSSLADLPEPLPMPADAATRATLDSLTPVVASAPTRAAASDSLASQPLATKAAFLVKDPGQERLDQARQLLKPGSSADDNAHAAQLLWHAVAKGNVAAEIDLARLYLSGSGVSKSCAQASALLDAAQKRNSARVQQLRDEFSQYGCE